MGFRGGRSGEWSGVGGGGEDTLEEKGEGDSVVGRLVRRWRQWYREVSGQENGNYSKMIIRSFKTLDHIPSQPRYRESLLGEDHLEDQESKGWWKKRKRDIQSSENISARNSNSSTVFSPCMLMMIPTLGLHPFNTNT